MTISQVDFNYVAQLARTHAGILLEAGKEYLVETRLGTLAEHEGFGSVAALIERLRAQPSLNGIHHKTLCALATHETFFFRDFNPFEALRRSMLPGLLEERAGSRQLRIWSAACSTGQEPYSIAMLLREHFPQAKDWEISILATDFDPEVLETARAGRYSQFEVNRGLPARYLVKYFTQEGSDWLIKDEVKELVEFREMNLVEPWPILPPFDVVLLRNVMIYFGVDTKRSILKKIGNCLLPHGFLFLGTSETTINLDPGYQPVTMDKAVAYRPQRSGMPG
jgi:chemotaxis protein methyltransferase CheR